MFVVTLMIPEVFIKFWNVLYLACVASCIRHLKHINE